MVGRCYHCSLRNDIFLPLCSYLLLAILSLRLGCLFDAGSGFATLHSEGVEEQLLVRPRVGHRVDTLELDVEILLILFEFVDLLLES